MDIPFPYIIHPTTPSYQDVWLKFQQLSARYNDLLRQSRDLATNNQTLATEHLRLQKDLIATRTKNEELSADAVNYRIEAWRTNVRLEELSNEVQLLKNHRSQLLSLTKRSFDQIDIDAESAWSASCSSPISTTPSVSTLTTPVNATPTNSATFNFNDFLPNTFFLSSPPHQPAVTDQDRPEPTAGIRYPKRRKVIHPSTGECTLEPVGGEAPISYSAATIPTNPVQGHSTKPLLTASRSRTSPTQPRRTATRLCSRTPSITVEGPSTRTRSRAKAIPDPKPTAVAVAAAVASTAVTNVVGLPPISSPVPLNTENRFF